MQVTVIAAGVEKYDHLTAIVGPEADVHRLCSLLSTDPLTALVPQDHFHSLLGPTSAELRREITDYAVGRSAASDVLVLYFSGHGIPLGQSDFGLCTKDTFSHLGFQVPIPTSLVRLTDIVETLACVKVTPIIIIDACFSGQAGAAIELKRIVKPETGEAYALLCSSTRHETTPSMLGGGPFSIILDRVAREGLGDQHIRKPVLTLRDLWEGLQKAANMELESTPQLFLGEGLPDVPLVRNVQYKPRIERFTKAYYKVLKELWNNGSPRTLSTHQLLRRGSTIYTTYRKAGYAPAWALIEAVEGATRQLSARGVEFMKDELEIPCQIQQDAVAKTWEAAPGTRYVKFSNFAVAFRRRKRRQG